MEKTLVFGTMVMREKHFSKQTMNLKTVKSPLLKKARGFSWRGLKHVFPSEQNYPGERKEEADANYDAEGEGRMLEGEMNVHPVKTGHHGRQRQHNRYGG